jgi:hypothetical protein
MALAWFDKLEDGSFAGRMPKCNGVVAFSKTLKGCENELRSPAQGARIEGPFAGTRRHFMVYQEHRLAIPTNKNIPSRN